MIDVRKLDMVVYMVYIFLFNRFFFEGRGGGGGGGVNGCVLKINKFIKIDFCFF